MNHTPTAPRRLTPADAPAYRALMLQAYADEPDAFTSTAAERRTRPLAWWEARVADAGQPSDGVQGIWIDGLLVAAAGLAREDRERTAHKALLFGMYVLPGYRQRGLARALVEALLAQAEAVPALRVVQLTVTDTNLAARQLYERCGFIAFGTEPMAMQIGSRFVSKLHMWRPLGEPPDGRPPDDPRCG